MVNLQIQEAYACFQKRDYQSAESILKQLITQHPNLPEPRAHLANLLYFHKRYAEALEVLEPIKEMPGMDCEYDWAQFNTCWIAGDFQAAADHAYQLLSYSELVSERLKHLMNFSRQSANFSLAIHIAKQAHLLNELNEIQWLQRLVSALKCLPLVLRRKLVNKLSISLRKFCRWRRLHLLYEAAHISDPQNPDWSFKIAQLERQIRDVYNPEYTQEQAWYEITIKIEPQHHEARFFLCRTLFDMGRWADLIALIPDSDPSIRQQEFMKMKTAALLNLGEIDQSEQLYQECLQLWKLPFYHFCLGLIAFQKKSYQDAKQLFIEAQNDVSLKPLGLFFLTVIQAIESGQVIETIDGQLLLDELIHHEMCETGQESKYLDDELCCLCGDTSSKSYLWTDRTTNWRRYRCHKCMMISVAPMPSEDEITALYVNETRSEHTLQKRYKHEVESLFHIDETQCRNLPLYRDITEWHALNWSEIENALPEKSFLDVGCSAGRAVLVMQKCGWQAEGIDLDDDAIRFGQSLGLQLETATIEQKTDQKQYAMITLLDVIEHVSDPISLLIECHKRLLTGGILLVKTPCADSLPHYFLGNRWLESSEHLQFFSRKTLSQSLNQAGYNILSIKQQQQAPTHFLHDQQWQGRFFPEYLILCMDQFSVGDTISVLAQKT